MFLLNKNMIFKIRRSKVTDYAALNANSTSLYHIDDRKKKLTVDCRLQILESTWACSFKGIQSGPEK